VFFADDLESWNSESLWRHAYGDVVKNCLFFAEDVFGNQFCLRDAGVLAMDAETGELEKLAASLEGWAKLILDERDFRLGFPLAHAWQQAHGPIPPGRRLVPVTPFVLGGEYDISNLRAIDAPESMRFRGELASQIRDLPEGAQIQLKVTD